ncbi:HAD-IA family hydrolase [Litoreibacter roseus]|uniref:phosphoglycolate phosphatase n=1 Tax=Litoreibacter roseus TaxID=2601869 RepID=A0A6N6JHP5_9RHOB|nr:HAD-IA family hydrolase [Litoreibacter roseus]GFE65776.1 phosphoglycolate phosphatase [Litoreibacter roseus]
MRCVVFDLDGTLADTSGDLIAAANFCFRDLGHGDLLDPTLDAATALRGARAMLRLGFERLGLDDAEEQIDAQYPTLIDAYGDNIDTHTVLYPGVREAVDRLKALDMKVAICTNKPEGLAETLMARLEFRDVFDALIGADTLPVRKPDPAPLFEAIDRSGGARTSAVLIGDTATDRNTARAAGIPSVLVTFGPGEEDVSDLEPEALLHHYDELDSVIEAVI